MNLENKKLVRLDDGAPGVGVARNEVGSRFMIVRFIILGGRQDVVCG